MEQKALLLPVVGLEAWWDWPLSNSEEVKGFILTKSHMYHVFYGVPVKPLLPLYKPITLHTYSITV